MAEWKSIAGENNWSGLLEPTFNNDLCQRIVDCGQRVKVVYDSINVDVNSSNYGLPRFAKEDLFSEIGPDRHKTDKPYEVKQYIYALADVVSKVDWIVKDRSVWMGYVAVTTDKGKQELGRRDILICWRGTLLAAEWLKNAQASQIEVSDIFKNSNGSAYVHNGFHSLYTSSAENAPYNNISARNQVLDAVTQLVNQYKEEEISITVTGHSLGAALATLNAADMVANNKNKVQVKNAENKEVEKEFMVTAFVFASPMVGNKGFKHSIKGLPKLHVLHINHLFDIVPKLPIIDFSGLLYRRTGINKVIHSASNFVNSLFRPMQMKTYFHSLENLLQLILQEVEGSGRSGRLDVEKYYALVEDTNGNLKLCEVPATSGA